MFLDEPTTGLDPQSRAHMWDEVRRLRDEGVTVFITTHYLDEADALCDRICIMDGGEIVAEGTPESLKREISGDVVTVGVPAHLSDKALSLATAESFTRRAEVIGDGSVRLYVESGAVAIPHLLRILDGAGIEPGAIELHRPSLDDVFLAKTGRTLRES